MSRQTTLADDLHRLAWRPGSEQEVSDEAAAQGTGRRPARPGEEFTLVIHRNPGSKSRPNKNHKPKPGEKQKMVKEPGMSVNDWMGADPIIRIKLVDELIRLAAEAADEQQCPSFLNGMPYVQVSYYFKDRLHRDWANYGKQVIDALEVDRRPPDPKRRDRPRKPGIIAGDSDDQILLDRNRIVTGAAEPRIEVYLRDTRGMTPEQVADLFRASALEQCRRLIPGA